MPRKAAPKPDDPERSKRFIETAKEVGADEDAEALERAFKNIATRARSAPIESPGIPVCRQMRGIDSILGGGSMAKAYSADMRERVIGRVESGASRREAAEHESPGP